MTKKISFNGKPLGGFAGLAAALAMGLVVGLAGCSGEENDDSVPESLNGTWQLNGVDAFKIDGTTVTMYSNGTSYEGKASAKNGKLTIKASDISIEIGEGQSVKINSIETVYTYDQPDDTTLHISHVKKTGDCDNAAFNQYLNADEDEDITFTKK